VALLVALPEQSKPEKAIYHYWPFWKYRNVPAFSFSIKGEGRYRNITSLLAFLIVALFFLAVHPISTILTWAYPIDLAVFSVSLSLFLAALSQVVYPTIFIDPDCYICSASDYLIQLERSKLLGTYSRRETIDHQLRSAEDALRKKYALERFGTCPACQIEKLIEDLRILDYEERPNVDSDVLQEWDVTRRTAEFFDGAIGNLRTYGLTASVTIVSIAFEFHVPPLLLTGALLNVGLFFVDKRFESYLKATASYSIKLEDKYRFADEGLGHAIHRDRERYWLSRPEHVFRFLYVVLGIAAVLGYLILTGIGG
jgi:hypothetical protein